MLARAISQTVRTHECLRWERVFEEFQNPHLLPPPPPPLLQTWPLDARVEMMYQSLPWRVGTAGQAESRAWSARVAAGRGMLTGVALAQSAETAELTIPVVVPVRVLAIAAGAVVVVVVGALVAALRVSLPKVVNWNPLSFDRLPCHLPLLSTTNHHAHYSFARFHSRHAHGWHA